MPRTIKRIVPATTKNLTDAVINHINLAGGFAFRVNTSGTYSKEKRKWIRSGARPGVSDVIAVYKGRAIFIEIKNEATKDRMKPGGPQEVFMNKVKAAHGNHLIVKNLVQFHVDWFDISLGNR